MFIRSKSIIGPIDIELINPIDIRPNTT